MARTIIGKLSHRGHETDLFRESDDPPRYGIHCRIGDGPSDMARVRDHHDQAQLRKWWETAVDGWIAQGRLKRPGFYPMEAEE